MPTRRLAQLMRTAAEEAGRRLGFALPDGFTPVIETPRDPAHGDYASPLALSLAKAAGRSPLAIAEAIRAAMPADPMLAELTVAPPGFLNVRLSDRWLQAQLEAILTAGDAYGRPEAPPAERLSLHFAPAEPGALSAGALRLAIWLSAIGALWRFAGGPVERQAFGLTAGSEAVLAEAGVRFEARVPAPENFASPGGRWLKLAPRTAEYESGGHRSSSIRCMRDGIPLRQPPTASQLLTEVGADAVRFFMLQRPLGVEAEIDLSIARRETPDNPLFYAQYAHARLSGILRLAETEGLPSTPERLAREDFRLLDGPLERELLRLLVGFPGEVAWALERFELHRLVRFAQTLATAFHRFYATCRIFEDEQAAATARLALILATRSVLEVTLSDLLGVSAPARLDQTAVTW